MYAQDWSHILSEIDSIGKMKRTAKYNLRANEGYCTRFPGCCHTASGSLEEAVETIQPSAKDHGYRDISKSQLLLAIQTLMAIYMTLCMISSN